MRQLSVSEQDALIAAAQEYEPTYVGYSIEELQGFEAGFISGLDHAAEQIAALTAERDGLAMQVKDLEELRDYLRNALQDEAGIQKNMREANAYLARERKKAEAALAEIAAGNPAPPGGTWLSDAKMAQIARRALDNPTT